MTAKEIFNAAKLQPKGPVRWNQAIAETRCGVYVIAVSRTAREEIDISYLPPEIAARWLPSESVVYIGRTKRALSRRIREFYKHSYNAPRPHRGGQDIKLLRSPLWVYWAQTDNPSFAEDRMIEYFKGKAGYFPFGNRVRSAQSKSLLFS